MVYPPPSASFLQLILSNRRRRQRQRRRRLEASPKNQKCRRGSNTVTRSPRRKAKYVNEVGASVTYSPEKTFWFMYYLKSPERSDSHFECKFRNRFRLPYDAFLELYEIVKLNKLFLRWNRYKNGNNPRLGLLLLGVLRYLGRGWTYDDLEEATAISLHVHRDFIHIFLQFGREVLYPKHVKYPVNSAEMHNHTKEYEIAGFHGAVGSMDACHIVIERCSHRLKQNHLGGKSKQTCRSYNLTCNHRRQILHTTPGHPARWNDKTIVLYDELAVGMRAGKLMNDNEFELYDKKANGDLIKVKYKGSWLLVDNGYLNWGNTIAPKKSTIFRTEARWSEWLESMRKDVECTFGILKGRWRILKAGIRLHGVNAADNVWLTCCALHNWLLETDGYSLPWDGELGLHDINDGTIKVPYVLSRLQNGVSQRQYDSSGMGPGLIENLEDLSNKDDQTIFQEYADEAQNVVNVQVNCAHHNNVHELSSDVMREKLITHFNILFKLNKIKWPRRNN